MTVDSYCLARKENHVIARSGATWQSPSTLEAVIDRFSARPGDCHASVRTGVGFFVRLGTLKEQSPDSAEVQSWVKDLQAFFTENYYTCTPELLQSLGEMYAGGGAMTENIDAAGGEGTGAFARDAIACYCKK